MKNFWGCLLILALLYVAAVVIYFLFNILLYFFASAGRRCNHTCIALSGIYVLERIQRINMCTISWFFDGLCQKSAEKTHE